MKQLRRYKYWLLLLIPVAGLLYYVNILRDPVVSGDQQSAALEIAIHWNEIILEYDQYAEGYRSPISARMWAYVQMAAWETSLPGMPGRKSVMTAVHGPELPAWNQRHRFILPVALNAAYAIMSERFFYHAPALVKEKGEDYSKLNFQKLFKKFANDDFMESKKFGEAIANEVFKWSASDVSGHMAHMFNYDKNYKPIVGEGKWVEDEFEPMPALLPGWGKVRTFLVDTGTLDIPPPLAYSVSKGAPFFAEALEVYNSSFPVTEEKRWIAEFWRDDIPGTTFTGASRWISVANQVAVQKNVDFPTAMETFLKISLALNDVAVNIWKLKYDYNYLRPSTYIRQNLDYDWEPMHSTPPFPAYPSGHSALGEASSVILGQLYGPMIHFKDRSHEGKTNFMSKPRTFNSFEEMAIENAYARILIGAHFRMDCEAGMRIGKQVGEKVNLLPCRGDAMVEK